MPKEKQTLYRCGEATLLAWSTAYDAALVHYLKSMIDLRPVSLACAREQAAQEADSKLEAMLARGAPVKVDFA